jgi:hypothetical protein
MSNASNRVRTLVAIGSLVGASFAGISVANAQTTTTTTDVTTPPPPTTQTTVTTPAPPPPPPPPTVIVQTPQPVVGATTTSSGAVRREEREEGYMPNRYLLTTGLILWGVPYLTGVVVAAQSSNTADQHLYVPIVGPWVDLGQRGSCPVSSNDCNTETTNKVLLGVDGVLQAVGTLEVLWGFLRPEHREVTTVSATRYTPKMTFAPARLGSGYGLTAFAQF